MSQLGHPGLKISFDEQDYLCDVGRTRLRPQRVEGVRRATVSDLPQVASLRAAFECEYFGVAYARIDQTWCLRAAERYVAQGAWVAQRDGCIVSMVAVEADIPGITHIGAVYTLPAYRGRGLAKGVTSATCEEQLAAKERVTLTVRIDNLPALSAYAALGFQRREDYRMCRLA